jgi:glycosyltransferase involved in cell wall biosynthesis
MKRFAYISADPGIPIPGSKGASIHVACVCRALRQAGLAGEVFTVRPEAESIEGAPLHPIAVPPRRGGASTAECTGEREARLFLAGLDTAISPSAPPDFIYERYSLWHAGGLARARALDIPFILEVNSPLPEEARRFRDLTNVALAEGIAELLLGAADGIVCVSEEIARWVESRRGRSDGIWVVPNGVDEALFSPRDGARPAPLPPRGTPLIAFSGSFRPWHGLEDLLAAFEILVRGPAPDAHLLLVGDGPARAELEASSARVGLAERVHITGLVPHAEVPRWLAGADLAVAPYPRLEHFWYSPLKLYEFLALGLPVVATDVGQIREALAGGERGLLSPPGDPEALARAMAELLEDRGRARTLAAAGREWVLENATWGRRVGDILERVRGL